MLVDGFGRLDAELEEVGFLEVRVVDDVTVEEVLLFRVGVLRLAVVGRILPRRFTFRRLGALKLVVFRCAGRLVVIPLVGGSMNHGGLDQPELEDVDGSGC